MIYSNKFISVRDLLDERYVYEEIYDLIESEGFYFENEFGLYIKGGAKMKSMLMSSLKEYYRIMKIPINSMSQDDIMFIDGLALSGEDLCVIHTLHKAGWLVSKLKSVVFEPVGSSDELSELKNLNVLKMFYGLAQCKYDYNPEAIRNSATGNNVGSIACDLEKWGLKTNSDTVRDYLQRAVQEFGYPTKPRNNN